MKSFSSLGLFFIVRNLHGYFCFTGSLEFNAFMRKPNPGMFFDIARKHLLRLDSAFTLVMIFEMLKLQCWLWSIYLSDDKSPIDQYCRRVSSASIRLI